MATYATRDNLDYIDQLYQQFKANPESVSTEWRKFFEGVEFASNGSFGLSEKELDVYHLITAYRNYGHFEANLDPLTNTLAPSDQLSLQRFSLTEKDLDQRFQIGAIIGKPNATLKEIIAHLKSCYCGTLTVQCAEALPEVRNWFIKEFEKGRDSFKLSADEKKSIFASITKTESLEKFIHTRYVGTKRFSIEGGDALIPMMETLIQRCTSLGGQEIMIGMAHRGRVNVLANLMGKGLEYIFADFNGPTETAVPIDDFDGDVKYHLGYHATKQTANGDCDVTLAFNPSHLEAVNPVVLGMARAAQRRRKDTEKRKTVIPVLIHGDAAFAGQGIVLETFQMSNVKGYTVGGTIHLAIDNQIGFTTNPENSRSAHYCTDTSKVIATPVLHCNSDDVEACVRAMDIALRYRQEWGRDVVINIVCYRRFGHNEGDEPAYTQPLMYDIIRKHPTLREIYGKKLMHEGVIDQAFYESQMNEKMESLQKVYEHTKTNPPKIQPFKFDGFWTGLRKAKADDFEKPTDTTIDLAKLKKIGKFISEVPAGFNIHPKLVKLLEARKNMSDGKEMIDWGMGELLAYGSLISEGTSVRLSGQDCVRGTFTHRHSGFYDSKTNEGYLALKHLNPPTEFCVYDSVLSEYGVLGFEYGNAICDPTFLTMWEAQFGDFANGAQIIIDQFITAGEAKWQQMCGLVVLLPHGYEGQGPEHSSAKFERFLQMCAQNNIQVTNLTTPAQIFHALRRQIKRPFRKPLINMSPKSLLRHPRAVSSIEELAKGTFQEVIPDTLLKDSKKVETLALCTGKVYYELLEEREKLKSEKTALVRIEQLYPTPLKQIAAQIRSYPNLKNVVWVQEEPKNMGAYQFIYFKLSELFIKEGFSKLGLHYVGRGERSSPATGSVYRHKAEQAEIIKNAFTI
ncbi:MAG: 2-oxoglutarate dehydrogenase subunit E1 [Oligoflexia bacterium]|nr:MAG: 2-oxoglutarate dehydrogenase subunit E1 [Oligoflexia bacterium]